MTEVLRMKYENNSNDRLERCELIAQHIVKSGCTVRDAAKKFEISKSTVHKDVTEKLQRVNPVFYEKVRLILNRNKSERHIRGGNATKKKFDIIRKSEKK